MEQSGIDLQQGLPGLPEGLVEPTEVVGMGVYLAAGIAVLLLVAVLAVLGIGWARRLLAQRRDRAGLPPRREAEEALLRLQLNAGKLTTAEFTVALSAALRRCVDRIWKTGLSHQTWHEHWSENGNGLAALPERGSQALAQLLADCNGLKFEPVEISPEEKEVLLQRALDWIAQLPSRVAPAPPKRPETVSR